MSTILRSDSRQAQNLVAALDLMEFGYSLMRQRILRSLHDASDEEIELELQRWLLEQPVNFIPRKRSEDPIR